MNYQTFIDYITSQGCSWMRFSSGGMGHLYYNQGSGKVAYVTEDTYVPKKFVMLFCTEIGIDPPDGLM